MRERTEQILKIACFALAALLLYQLVRAVIRSNPLANVSIPELPSLAANTNAPAGTKTTNAVAADLAKKGTNAPAKGATNAPANVSTNASTNASTNVSTNVSTNAAAPVLAAAPDTNSVSPGNLVRTVTVTMPVAVESGSNAAISPAQLERLKTATNGVVRVEAKGGTNLTAEMLAGRGDTNAAAARAAARARMSGAGGPDAAMMAMGGSRPGRGGPAPELSPAIKARVYRIYDSEVFGPVMRPLPMALLGIAGNTAFLRSPSGQTGLVKEGDSLGELKLVKIGINRVLVEQDGEKKELMIFSGYGGESLLPKPQESSK